MWYIMVVGVDYVVDWETKVQSETSASVTVENSNFMQSNLFPRTLQGTDQRWSLWTSGLCEPVVFMDGGGGGFGPL